MAGPEWRVNRKKFEWQSLIRLIDALGVYIGRIVDVGVLGKDCYLNVCRGEMKNFGKSIKGFWIMGIAKGIVRQVYLVIVLVKF